MSVLTANVHSIKLISQSTRSRMKPFGYLAMAGFLFYAAYRYVIQTRSVRQDFPKHIVSKAPIRVTRAIGLAFAACGFYFVYLAAT